MSFTWKLSEIRTRVRRVAGVPDSSQHTDSDLTDRINDFLRNRFPFNVEIAEELATYTQQLSATDDGEYDIYETTDTTKLIIGDPILLDGSEIIFSQDRQKFFESYPPDQGGAFVISDAGAQLAAFTGSVSFAALKYNIAGQSYSLDAGTVALSGDTVPEDTYGAWRLEVDVDGTVSIVEAGDNVSGYTTPGLAVRGLPNESSTAACLGFVTALNDSGPFIPGVTPLSTSNVTATFTDGWHSTRQRPLEVLYWANKLFVRPKSDDWHELLIPYQRKSDELATDESIPDDERFGELLAYGVAVEIMMEDRDIEGAVVPQSMFEQLRKELNQKYYKQKQVTRTALARF